MAAGVASVTGGDFTGVVFRLRLHWLLVHLPWWIDNGLMKRWISWIFRQQKFVWCAVFVEYVLQLAWIACFWRGRRQWYHRSDERVALLASAPDGPALPRPQGAHSCMHDHSHHTAINLMLATSVSQMLAMCLTKFNTFYKSLFGECLTDVWLSFSWFPANCSTIFLFVQSLQHPTAFPRVHTKNVC